jgi:hypothetical protein
MPKSDITIYTIHVELHPHQVAELKAKGISLIPGLAEVVHAHLNLYTPVNDTQVNSLVEDTEAFYNEHYSDKE